MSDFTRKYKGKYLENKQKSEKNAFFHEKKCVLPCFVPKNRYFLVILRAN